MRCSRWRCSAAGCCARGAAASSARTGRTRRRSRGRSAWWPHAIENGLHPLLTDRVYAPDGWNLAWTSSIPGPALLAWPLTAVFGPVAAYDVLALAAPALAAWCTYLLCREIGTGTPAALAGGLVFGFTSYEAAETLNHLNLALVFTLPLAGLVVARYLHGGLSDRRFVVLLRAVRARGVRDVPGDAVLGDARRRARAAGRASPSRAARERALLFRCLVLCSAAYGDRARRRRRRSCGSRWRTPIRSGSAATATSSTSRTCSCRRA